MSKELPQTRAVTAKQVIESVQNWYISAHNDMTHVSNMPDDIAISITKKNSDGSEIEEQLIGREKQLFIDGVLFVRDTIMPTAPFSVETSHEQIKPPTESNNS